MYNILQLMTIFLDTNPPQVPQRSCECRHRERCEDEVRAFVGAEQEAELFSAGVCYESTTPFNGLAIEYASQSQSPSAWDMDECLLPGRVDVH